MANKLNWEKANIREKTSSTPYYGLTDKEMRSARKRKQAGIQKRRRKTTGMPKAGPVKVTKADGTVEIAQPYRGGSTNNIGLYKK